MFFYLGILGLIIQGTLSRRQTTHLVWPIGIGLTLTSVAYLGIAWAQSLGNLIGVLVLFELGLSLTMIYIPTLLSYQNKTANHNGGLMGVYESIGSLARIIGPLVAFLLFYSAIRWGYAVFAYSLFPLCVLFLVPAFRRWLVPTRVG
mgnify:FL=1